MSTTTAAKSTAADPTVDPRIAATGGRRRRFGDSRSNYEWPRMMAQPDWVKTAIHKATKYYGCAKCGLRFKTPHAVYTHLDKVHPALGSQPRRARLTVAKPATRPTTHLPKEAAA